MFAAKLKCFALLQGGRQPEVSEVHLCTLSIDKDIFGFQVTMKNIIGVTKLDRRAQLSEHILDQSIIASKDMGRRDEVEQCATRAKVHNDVEVVRTVRDDSPEVHDIRMSRDLFMIHHLAAMHSVQSSVRRSLSHDLHRNDASRAGLGEIASSIDSAISTRTKMIKHYERSTIVHSNQLARHVRQTARLGSHGD